MATFDVDKLGVLVGWSIQGLTGDALYHEQDPEFKDAFAEYLPTVFPAYTEAGWAYFPPTTRPFWFILETGSADDDDVKDYLKGVLQASGVTESIAVGPVTDPKCDNSPDGWERSRTFTVILAGSKMTLAPVAQLYSVTNVIDAEPKAVLSALDLLFRVRWTSVEV